CFDTFLLWDKVDMQGDGWTGWLAPLVGSMSPSLARTLAFPALPGPGALALPSLTRAAITVLVTARPAVTPLVEPCGSIPLTFACSLGTLVLGVFVFRGRPLRPRW